MQRNQDIGHLPDFPGTLIGCDCIGVNSRGNARGIGGEDQSVAAKSGDDRFATRCMDGDRLSSRRMAGREDKVYPVSQHLRR